MTPRSPYDTPANGDFARYVEQLGRAPVAPGDGTTPPAAPAVGQTRRPPRTAQPARGPASPLQPLRYWVQWGIVLFVVVQVGTTMFPAFQGLGWIALLLYGVAAFMRLRELPWSRILEDLRPKK